MNDIKYIDFSVPPKENKPKACTKEKNAAYNKEWQAKNKEKRAEYMKAWKAKNKEKKLLSESKLKRRTCRKCENPTTNRSYWYCHNHDNFLTQDKNNDCYLD